MRPARQDPILQTVHPGAAGERTLTDAATHPRGSRDDRGADRRLSFASDSGVELQYPARLVWPTPWVGHIPFAFWLVEALRPTVLVELGVHTGNSYCAFLQSIQSLSLPSRCFGVDHWRGDEHSDRYDEDVYAELRAYHDPQYGTFSTLIRSTFVDALPYFSDDSIDLLHIDGFHTYEAVSADFSGWLPKMSARGVVLFHDINVRERDFGVWRFWEEIVARYETFAFVHAHGLGAAYVGREPLVGPLRALFTASDPDSVGHVRAYFGRLGASLIDRFERRQAEQLAARADSRAAELETLAADTRRLREEAEGLRHDLERADKRALALEGELAATRAEVTRRVDSEAALQRDLSAARAETVRLAAAATTQREQQVAFRAEAARRVDEAAMVRQQLSAVQAALSRHVQTGETLQQELVAAQTESARHREALAAVERELAMARRDVDRHEAAAERAALVEAELRAVRAALQEQRDARERAANALEDATRQGAELHEELVRARARLAEALEQRDRATLLLRQQVAATASLQRALGAATDSPNAVT